MQGAKSASVHCGEAHAIQRFGIAGKSTMKGMAKADDGIMISDRDRGDGTLLDAASVWC